MWRNGNWVADAGTWVPPDRVVEWCLEDRHGNLWVATLGKGIFCYTTNAPVRQITVKDGLGSDLVRVLFEDAEGNLWCGWGMGSAELDGVVVFSQTGERIGRIALPERCANLCFGGRRRNPLFMAARRSVYSLYVNASGSV